MEEKEIFAMAHELVDKNGDPLTDNLNFRTQEGSFDTHRIFKLPHTVDASTGVLVAKDLQTLPFEDVFYAIE